MSLREVVVVHNQEPGTGLNVVEQAKWASLSEELLNTPVPVMV